MHRKRTIDFKTFKIYLKALLMPSYHLWLSILGLFPACILQKNEVCMVVEPSLT